MKNEVIKPISQIGVTYAAKTSFNKAVELVLGVDHSKYKPSSSKFDKTLKSKPLYVVREEKARKAEEKTQKAKILYDKVKTEYSALLTAFDNIKKDIPEWIKSISVNLFLAQKKSKSIAENLDFIAEKMPEETAIIESEVDTIENELNPPESEKVTTKRKRRRRVTKPK